MSVYIPGMEMPTSCRKCLDVGWHYVFECVLDDVECGERRTDCPLIPVPPHGRLIDADALLESDLGGEPYKSVVRRVLMQAPTIIPAEEGEGCLIAENAQGLKSASSMRIAVCL